METCGRRRKILFWVLVLLGMVSCATPPVTPIGQAGEFQPEDDERRLWARAEEEQQRLDTSRLIDDDPALNEYINRVAQRLVPDEVKKQGISIRVKVIKSPYLNAFAYPNGVIYVHTGILARMQNEAQLATLLGHEMSHVIHRHAYESMRNLKQQAAIGAMVGVLPVVGLLGGIGVMAAITGYSRDLEREADQEGMILTVRSGYDPEESPKLFIAIQKDILSEGEKEPFFFGSHPRIQERIDSYNEAIKNRYGHVGGEKNEEAFMTRTFPVLIENAELDLSMGRLDPAQKGIEKALQREPDHPKAHYLLGEVYRRRGSPGDRDKAVEEYRRAIERDVRFPDPHRGLGMIHMKKGDRESAVREFQNYLLLNPEAEDKGYIEQYVRDLNTH